MCQNSTIWEPEQVELLRDIKSLLQTIVERLPAVEKNEKSVEAETPGHSLNYPPKYDGTYCAVSFYKTKSKYYAKVFLPPMYEGEKCKMDGEFFELGTRGSSISDYRGWFNYAMFERGNEFILPDEIEFNPDYQYFWTLTPTNVSGRFRIAKETMRKVRIH